MCSLVGEVSAARVGRGIRCTEKPAEDYQVVLPHLPTGASVLNTVFLHGDVKARPYRVEHVRDSLARLSLLPEVVALGAYQMNHLWAVTFKDEEGKKKILAADAFNVKDHRCMVIDPRDQGVRLKLYWLLHGVPDDDVRVALAPFGKVTEISRDKWKVKGCIDKGSTTRSVTLKLKVGVTVDDLPHQLRVAEDMALVFVPGRAPLCLRCRGTGHIRRECRVPRCGICRRFGHDDSQCVRSYASVTGPLRSDVVSEHLMDAADAEEASREYNDGAKTAATPPEASSGVVQEANGGAEPSAAASETMPETTTDDAESKAANTSLSVAQDADQEVTDAEMLTTGSVAAKRPYEDSDNIGKASASGTGEPPTKASTGRRSSVQPKPKLPPDRRVNPTTPPH